MYSLDITIDGSACILKDPVWIWFTLINIFIQQITLKIWHPFRNIYPISAFCLRSKTEFIAITIFASAIHFFLRSENFMTSYWWRYILVNNHKNGPKFMLVLSEVESRTQGSRPRTQKKSEAKDKDRNARGQGQGPRTQPQVFSKKKRFSKKFFRPSLIYRRSQKFWLGGLNNKSRAMTSSKICLLALNQDFA